jgi:hypothetical protein
MRGEKGWMSMGIYSMNMLRSMYLLVWLLIWISPILVSPRAGFGWTPRVSMKFLLGRKNVCLMRKRVENNWTLLHFGLTNWVDNFEGVWVLVHGLVARIGIGVVR